MIQLMQSGKQPFHAVRFDGQIYDCGSKLGFLTANVALALERAELADDFRREVRRLLDAKA